MVIRLALRLTQATHEEKKKNLSCSSAGVRLHGKRDFWHVWLSTHHVGNIYALMHIV